MNVKLWRLEIFFLEPHHHSQNDRTLNWASSDIKVIWACHICHDGEAPWRCTMRSHSSQWSELSEPRYRFVQDCSTLSSAASKGDLNDLLVHPRCTSLDPDEFWCRSVALCKSYIQYAALQANLIFKKNKTILGTTIHTKYIHLFRAAD